MIDVLLGLSALTLLVPTVERVWVWRHPALDPPKSEQIEIAYSNGTVTGPWQGDQWPGFKNYQAQAVVSWLKDGEDHRSLAMVLFHAEQDELERRRREKRERGDYIGYHSKRLKHAILSDYMLNKYERNY